MPVEIERKFLLRDDRWKPLVIDAENLRDGIFASSNGNKVRIRVYPNKATITLKSKTVNYRRYEFESELPLSCAEEILAQHCNGLVMHKTRHKVPFAGLMWEVDVYGGELQGIVIADVELTHVKQHITLPQWAGREVTGDPAYKNSYLRTLLASRQLASSGEPLHEETASRKPGDTRTGGHAGNS